MKTVEPGVRLVRATGALVAILTGIATTPARALEVVPGEGASIQAAIDATPGRAIFVPPGDYRLTAAIRLTKANSGLWGPGVLVQTNPDAEIIDAEGVDRLELRDLVLTRADGRQETHRPGVRLIRCADVRLENLRILDNRGDLAAVFAAYCSGLQVKNCLIQNYSRVSVDDRTTIPSFGFAFNCINGTGLLIRHSTGTVVAGNRIIESRMLPTPELQQQYGLGKFVRKNPVKGTLTSAQVWDAEYFGTWRQGAALQITKGETSDYVRVTGNYIETAALGIDIHGDHVIVANNLVNDAYVGMKAVHGSRNVLIQGNQFIRCAFAGIRLMPGSSSHAAIPESAASAADPADPEALTWPITRAGPNTDGHTLVANNIISDFGYGLAAWTIDPADGEAAPFHFNRSPAPGRIPPLRGVIVEGNLVYDPGRDGVMVAGQSQVLPPRYRYAVHVMTGPGAAEDLHFAHNLFHPGLDGVSNAPLGK